jgi:hypothetical protein
MAFTRIILERRQQPASCRAACAARALGKLTLFDGVIGMLGEEGAAVAVVSLTGERGQRNEVVGGVPQRGDLCARKRPPTLASLSACSLCTFQIPEV